jgi:glutamate carboxypeptidase
VTETIDLSAAVQHLDGALRAYLRDLEELVNIDSGTFDKVGVDLVAEVLQSRYARMGAQLEVFPHNSLGDTFSASFEGNGTQSVLLVGHTDTVFSKGTALERPFRIDGARAQGPGVADMKSGDVSIVYALQAIMAQERRPFRRLTVVHNSDEEIGSPSSRELIRAKASEADAIFVLEAGRENGDIVSARKGIAECRLHVHGRSAHAGVNHERGHSAILELSHLIVALEALNGTIPGVTLNVGRVDAGERVNVVPDHAFAHFEVRAFDAQSMERALERVEELAQRRTVRGTRAELQITIEHHPMHRSPESERLVSRAQSLAERIGFTIRDTRTGGASDGNTAAAAGRPVLDGLGPIGGQAHSPDEYIQVPSIVPRTALLAGLIAAVGSGDW